MEFNRREFVKLSALTGAGVALPAWARRAAADVLAPGLGLSDPELQPLFVSRVANALAPEFLYQPDKRGNYKVTISEGAQYTGLVDRRGRRKKTRIFGYKDRRQKVTWPGRTFQIRRNNGETRVRWQNDLPNYHLLPVDESVHWCFSLHGDSSANGVDYRQFGIQQNGVPITTHVHGGHSDFQYDGNPEFFFTPDAAVTGPQWDAVPGGFTNDFRYDNDVPAGSIWYHDHALGLTRLNVYAGMAGFYFIRDDDDTGDDQNRLGLPWYPHEMALAIQDRMFLESGDLFYPAFPGDPFYEGFITDEGAMLPPDLFPGGGPTALAEFFGDHMVVNGAIWPKADVDRTCYRLRLLNGCDSRFLVVRFRCVADGVTDPNDASASQPVPFWVIGSDQGLGNPRETDTLVVEPGGRYDVLFDFSDSSLSGRRVIMENIGWDAPFGGDFGAGAGPDDLFPNRRTDRIMAFDVSNGAQGAPCDVSGLPTYSGVSGNGPTRQVALFEGKDEFGRLQPLLGTFVGGQWKAIAWHSPATETPQLGDTETWELYNFTGDAHPVHLHLVNFEILGRNEISFDSDDGDPGQDVLQHTGAIGKAPVITNVALGVPVDLQPGDGYYEQAPKDMVSALPEQVTYVRALFDKPGRYVWHCHILSHEDHEMMRVLEVQD